MGDLGDELNNMFNDWERRMRARKKNIDENEESMFDSFISNIKHNTSLGDDFSKLKELGEPDDIEEFEEEGVKFVKKTWITEEGEYIMMETVMDESGNIFTGSKSLDEQLEEALENEEYEKAAELRDKIAEKKINDELFTDKPNVKLKK